MLLKMPRMLSGNVLMFPRLLQDWVSEGLCKGADKTGGRLMTGQTEL
jgi:hypothetical protein